MDLNNIISSGIFVCPYDNRQRYAKKHENSGMDSIHNFAFIIPNIWGNSSREGGLSVCQISIE